jgi:tripartite ATP-independent transporter DctM subunit
MIEHIWPILMLLGLMAGIFSGYPVAFVLAGVGILFALITGIPILFLSLGVGRIFSGVLANWLLVAIPLFVFMGLMLERSGIAERLLRSLASVFRGLPGGLAFAVAIIGVVMAASTGIIGASVVLMGMMALPAMKENNYDMRLAAGLIASSGTLGILIPPSIMLIILGDQLRLSVGDLFMGAIVPGLLLGGLYVGYLIAVAVLGAAPDATFGQGRSGAAGLRDLVAGARPAGADAADPVGAGHHRHRPCHADRKCRHRCGGRAVAGADIGPADAAHAARVAA